MSSKPKDESVKISLNESQFNAMIDVLHSLTMAIASGQVRRENGTDRNAHFLKAFGLSEREIADLLNITQQAVSLALQKNKKKSKKGQKSSVDSLKEA